MKKLLLLLIFLKTIQVFTQADIYNYKFTYDVVFKLKILKNKDTINETINEKMVLLLNNTKSLYISPTKLLIDSVRLTINKKGGTPFELNAYKKKLPDNKIKTSVEKIFKQKKYIFNYDMTLTNVAYEESLPVFNWKLKNTKKEILGYKCQLASLSYGGREYEAWFTENIEIQNGPYIFYGLPGLILEIYDTKKEYSFKLLGIAKEEKKFPEQKGNVVKTTKKDFDKAVTNVYKTIENRILGDSKIEFKRRIADLKKNKIINPLEIEE